jgi:hypothetical protein
MIIGAFLPWISSSSQSLGGSGSQNAFQLGTQASFRIDGEILLVLGVIVAVAGIVRLKTGQAPWFVAFAGTFCGVVVIIMCVDQYFTQGAFGSLDGGTSVGYGLVVALIAGVASFVAGILLRMS